MTFNVLESQIKFLICLGSKAGSGTPLCLTMQASERKLHGVTWHLLCNMCPKSSILKQNGANLLLEVYRMCCLNLGGLLKDLFLLNVLYFPNKFCTKSRQGQFTKSNLAHTYSNMIDFWKHTILDQ